MSKHKIGPWLFRQSGTDESEFEVYPDRVVGFGVPSEIALVTAHYADDFDDQVEEARRYARLIAAAPTMFEYIVEKAAEGDARAQAIMEAIHGGR